MGTITETKKYIIDGELRDTLLTILQLLRKHSTKRYWRYSDGYTDEIQLADGKKLKLPYLHEISKDLEQAEPVIEESEYNSSAEELILIAKELGLL